MSYPNADISFPGLFGDWRFTLSPKLLDIGNGIYWYGVLIAAGLLIALWFCMKRAPRYGLTEDDVIDTVLWAIPFAIVGARVYYALFYLDQFRLADGSIDWAETYRIWDGGLAIYGGILAAFLTAWLVCRKKKLSFWAMTDCCVAGIFIGQAIGRWGNFFNREAFGAETEIFCRMGLAPTISTCIRRSCMRAFGTSRGCCSSALRWTRYGASTGRTPASTFSGTASGASGSRGCGPTACIFSTSRSSASACACRRR